MTIAEIMAADLAATESDGESLTYTPSGGAGVAVTGWFVEEDPVESSVRDGEVRTRTARVWIPVASVAQPAAGDTVTKGSETWSVETFRPIADAVWQIRLSRAESRERSRDGYRIRR